MSIAKYKKLQIVSLCAALFALCHLISVKLRLLCYVRAPVRYFSYGRRACMCMRLSLPVRACAAVLFVCVRTAVFAGLPSLPLCRLWASGYGQEDGKNSGQNYFPFWKIKV